MRVRHSLLAITIATNMSIAVAACSDDESAPAAPADAGSGEAATPKPDGASAAETSTTGDATTCTLTTPPTDDPSCNTCAEEKCCEKVNGCFTDPQCSAFADCIVACLNDAGVPTDAGSDVDASGATSCAMVCRETHKGGAAKYAAAALCLQGSCGSVCKL